MAQTIKEEEKTYQFFAKPEYLIQMASEFIKCCFQFQFINGRYSNTQRLEFSTTLSEEELRQNIKSVLGTEGFSIREKVNL